MQTWCRPICSAKYPFKLLTTKTKGLIILFQYSFLYPRTIIFLQKFMTFDVLRGDVLELISFLAKCTKELILFCDVKGCSVKLCPYERNFINKKKNTLA